MDYVLAQPAVGPVYCASEVGKGLFELYGGINL